MFTVYPAIDVMGGRAVRLSKGKADSRTAYGDPADFAMRWIAEGARALHVVDLDAAFGTGSNTETLRRIAALGVPVQTGGGVRSLDAVKERMDAGIARVVLGTAAVSNPGLVAEAARLYPGRIAVGIDAVGGKAAVQGWTVDSGEDAQMLAVRMRALGVEWLVYTDVARDGVFGGVNLPETRRMVRASGMKVIASGGAESVRDIHGAREAGCAGIIVGKALYEGRLTLADALNAAASVFPSAANHTNQTNQTNQTNEISQTNRK